jgi:hypothetical protein
MIAILGWLLLGALLGLGGAHTHRKVRNFGGWSAARAWRDSGKKSGFQGHRDPAHRERPTPQAGRCDLPVVWALNLRQVGRS